ncbi:MAG: hypothetical protein ACREJQ_00155 [bacterium]
MGLIASLIVLILIAAVVFIGFRGTAEEKRQQKVYGGDTLHIEEDLGTDLLFEPNAFYFGTLMSGANVGPRYRLDHMYLRGPGTLTITPRYLRFKRMFDPGRPVTIPLDRVRSISVGEGVFANYWLPGRKVVRVHWSKSRHLITSGFAVPPVNHARWVAHLRREAQRFILK